MIISNTNRLILSKVTLEDAPFFLELLNTPNWLKYIGDRNIKSLDAAKQYLKDKIIPNYEKFGYGACKVQLKDTKETIGTITLLKRDELEIPDIGFAFLPQFEGKGYGYEASAEILKIAKQELKFEKIGAITLQINKKSIKLIEKLGLTFEKKIKPFDNDEELLLFAKEL